MEANSIANFQKCGEILIDINSKDKKNKVYIFHCTLCNIECDQLKKFSFHIGEEHLNDFENIFKETDIKIEAEHEEIQVETFTVIERPDLEDFESPIVGETNLNADIQSCKVKNELVDNYEEENITCDKEVMDCGASISDNNKKAKEKPDISRASGATSLMFLSESDDEIKDDTDHTPNKKRKINFDKNEKKLRQKGITNEISSDESKDGDCNLPSRKMSNDHSQHSKGKLNYFPPSVISKCPSCEELSKQFHIYKDAAEKRHNSLQDILAEHKVLLDTIVKQNAVATNLMEFFPINTEEKLKEFDALLVTHSDPYIRQIKSLLAGNAERNIHEVFGQSIIMNFNVDGSFGKKRLRDFPNVFKAIIDVISTFSEFSDKTLRAAFQRQKKKYFKQLGRAKAKSSEKQEIDGDSSNKEN